MIFKKRNGNRPTPAVGFETMLSKFSDSPILSDLRGAMAVAIGEYKSAHDAVARIAGDATLTDGARLVRQATVTRAKMTAALATLENARGKTAAGRKIFEAALRKPLDFSSSNLADISLAAETRAHLKNLPDAERSKFMIAAIDGVDLSSLRAIASAPAFLSGVPSRIHELARDRLLGVLAPEPLANSKTLAEGEAFAEQMEAELSQAVGNLVDFDSADELAKSAA